MNNTLYHHGIKGQKWGVRRYQNEDGEKTPLGKKHDKSIGKKVAIGLGIVGATGAIVGAGYAIKNRRLNNLMQTKMKDINTKAQLLKIKSTMNKIEMDKTLMNMDIQAMISKGSKVLSSAK